MMGRKTMAERGRVECGLVSDAVNACGVDYLMPEKADGMNCYGQGLRGVENVLIMMK